MRSPVVLPYRVQPSTLRVCPCVPLRARIVTERGMSVREGLILTRLESTSLSAKLCVYCDTEKVVYYSGAPLRGQDENTSVVLLSRLL